MPEPQSPPVVDPVGNPPSPSAADSTEAEPAETRERRNAARRQRRARAKASAPRGVHESEPKAAPVRPAPQERTYAEALSKEHRDLLKAEGVEY